jgi:predicted amidohydrolase YtcJ
MKKLISLAGSLSLVFLVGVSACGSPAPATARPTVPIPTEIPTGIPADETPIPPDEAADIIFHNGNVITIETAQPLAEAVAVRGGLIQAVGSDDEVLALQGPDTVLVDLQGKTLMPGFIEGHTHLLAFSDRMGKTVAEAQEAAIEYGITTVSEMWADENFVNQMLQIEQEGGLRLRVNLFPHYNEGNLENMVSPWVANWFPAHAPILDPGSRLRIPGIKIFVDGDFTPARGCWALSEPYLAAGLANLPCGSEYGDLYWPDQNELNQVVAQAQAAGYRVSFHAMGDQAIQAALDAIEFALAGQSNDLYRHMIQHSSMLRPDQMERYVNLGVISSVRGYADLCDPDGGLLSFGPDRRVWYANRYLLLNLNMHAFIESDFAWTAGASDRFANRTMDPFVNLHGIVTLDYVAPDGTVCPAADWVLSDGTTIERALQMYTIDPAYAISMEDYIGSIKPGKFADLIVLSGNPLGVDSAGLLDLRVWMTMINGALEYCADGAQAYCPAVDQAVVPADTPVPLAGQVAQVTWDCDMHEGSPIHVSAADSLQTTFKWAALTTDQVNDYMAALQVFIQVDGVSVPSAISHGEIEPVEGRDLVYVQSTFDVGMLSPGSHEICTTLTFTQPITDGGDWFGPGTQHDSLEGVCTVVSEP